MRFDRSQKRNKVSRRRHVLNPDTRIGSGVTRWSQTIGVLLQAVLAGLQGAPDSVTVMKCGTRGAREVGLDCSNRTDLLLHIHRNGERNGEDRELELFRAKILEHELAGPGQERTILSSLSVA